MACETVLDHQFGSATVIASGTHPENGQWLKKKSRCGLCGKPRYETVWIGTPPETKISPADMLRGGASAS